jgi:hypothetical protein
MMAATRCASSCASRCAAAAQAKGGGCNLLRPKTYLFRSFDRLDILIYVQPQGIGYEPSSITSNASSRLLSFPGGCFRCRTIVLATSTTIGRRIFELDAAASCSTPCGISILGAGKLVPGPLHLTANLPNFNSLACRRTLRAMAACCLPTLKVQGIPRWCRRSVLLQAPHPTRLPPPRRHPTLRSPARSTSAAAASP